MGSDDTHVTDPVLAVQEPESASAAKTKPLDGSGGADGSGASSPSSHSHQEQVQNLKGKCEVVDVPTGLEDNLIDESKAPVKESDITSVASMSSGSADPTPSDRSGGGDRSGAPSSWSERAYYLKENCRRAFGLDDPDAEWRRAHDSPWFVEVVAKLRADPCLDISKIEIEKAPYELKDVSSLHLAVLMGDIEMVRKILEPRPGQNEVLLINSVIRCASRYAKSYLEYTTLDLAIVCGESDIVDALLEKNDKVKTDGRGSIQLAVLYTSTWRTETHSKIIQSLVSKGCDINAKDKWGYSAFYVAVVQEKTGMVKELLSRWKDKIHLNEACAGGRPPIQIAHEDGFKDIESELMRYDDVRRYIDEAFRDRQAYVDAANAILVGAALIASVTFASWLQPPLNYTTSYHGSSVEYVDVEHNLALGSFWVFNTLSFYFAIGTVVFGAHSVLPRRQLFITENVKKLSQKLLLTSILLAFSVLFVIVAFGIAGFIVLIPILRYRWYMIAPTILGGIVCVGSIGYLFKSLWENLSLNIRNREKKKSEVDRMNAFYKYHHDGKFH